MANYVPMRRDSELVRIESSLSDIRDVKKSFQFRLQYGKGKLNEGIIQTQIYELERIENGIVRVLQKLERVQS
ncbi:MAG: hypothetical protein KJI69_04525 [Patescibacteria group bacterium]|nr:hypothetical protein [Patescibacteria group bacterium]